MNGKPSKSNSTDFKDTFQTAGAYAQWLESQNRLEKWKKAWAEVDHLKSAFSRLPEEAVIDHLTSNPLSPTAVYWLLVSQTSPLKDQTRRAAIKAHAPTELLKDIVLADWKKVDKSIFPTNKAFQRHWHEKIERMHARDNKVPEVKFETIGRWISRPRKHKKKLM